MIYGGENGLSDLGEFVQEAVMDLSQHLHEFDSIAVSGTSGLVVGAPVAVLLRKPLVVVRKDNDGSHSHNLGNLIENLNEMGERVLFLDDFISGGSTRQWVRKQVAQYGNADLIGQYLYQWHEGFTLYDDNSRDWMFD